MFTCLAYIDLNPVRAKMADTPEQSVFTSVRRQIHCFQGQPSENPDDEPVIPLLPFQETDSLHTPDHLPFTLLDYLDLADWSGRAVREGKHGFIRDELPPILARLGIDANEYLKMLREPRNRFGIAIGAEDVLTKLARRLRQAYIRGGGPARRLFVLRLK